MLDKKMDIDDLFGVDLGDPVQRLAIAQVESDSDLLDDLIAERVRQGLTQTDLAARMGVTQSAVARVESGDRDPRLATLGRYAHALGVLVKHEVIIPSKQPFSCRRAGLRWEYTDTVPRIWTSPVQRQAQEQTAER